MAQIALPQLNYADWERFCEQIFIDDQGSDGVWLPEDFGHDRLFWA